jgi:glycopeptide antibiotics resistance protein
MILRSGFGEADLFISGEANIMPPFVDLIHIFKNNIKIFIYFFAGNIVWFIPFGIFLRALSWLSSIKIVGLAFLFSFVIKLLQYAFGTDVAEIGDLILNTLGAFEGVVIFNYFVKNNLST